MYGYKIATKQVSPTPRVDEVFGPDGLHYQASENHDAWDALTEIRAPTLVMHGSEDQLTMPANATLLAERIPNAEMHLVIGGRHLFFIEFQAEAGRVVLDFLGRHPLENIRNAASKGGKY